MEVDYLLIPGQITVQHSCLFRLAGGSAAEVLCLRVCPMTVLSTVLSTVSLTDDHRALYSSQQAIAFISGERGHNAVLSFKPPVPRPFPHPQLSLSLPISLKPVKLSGHLTDHIATSLSFLSPRACSNSLIS